MEAPQITQRLLSRLRVLYGDKFSAQWADVSKEELASAWHADVTLRFGVEQIRRALEHLTTNSTFPPPPPPVGTRSGPVTAPAGPPPQNGGPPWPEAAGVWF